MSKGYYKIYYNIGNMISAGGIKISYLDRFILSYLKSLSESFSKVTPSVENICKSVGCPDRSSVTRAIRKLEKANLINVIRKRGHTSEYIITLDFERRSDIVRVVTEDVISNLHKEDRGG